MAETPRENIVVHERKVIQERVLATAIDAWDAIERAIEIAKRRSCEVALEIAEAGGPITMFLTAKDDVAHRRAQLKDAREACWKALKYREALIEIKHMATKDWAIGIPAAVAMVNQISPNAGQIEVMLEVQACEYTGNRVLLLHVKSTSTVEEVTKNFENQAAWARQYLKDNPCHPLNKKRDTDAVRKPD